MRARWVFDYPPREAPGVAVTHIAKWFPGRYYKILTVCLSKESVISGEYVGGPLAEMSPGRDPQSIKDRFWTQVYKCDKDGVIHGMHSAVPIFQQEYSERAQAVVGHKSVVETFAAK